MCVCVVCGCVGVLYGWYVCVGLTSLYSDYIRVFVATLPVYLSLYLRYKDPYIDKV